MRVVEEERRSSLNQTLPSIPQELIYVEASEEEQEGWTTYMRDEGTNVFGILDFDFMLMEIKMVGEKIQDTHQNGPLGDYWKQMLPLPKGPLGIPPLPSQDLSFVPLHLEKEIIALPPPIVETESQTLEEGEYV